VFNDDVTKWRLSEIRRVVTGQSNWSHCEVLIAAEILQHVQAPLALWDIFETPRHVVSDDRAIAGSRAAIRIARYDQLPASTFDLTVDAWLIYLAVEKGPSRIQRALAVEMLDPYDPCDCDWPANPPYGVPIGDLTQLKHAFSLDLKKTGLWFAEAFQ
jgi:hypothetical protein